MGRDEQYEINSDIIGMLSIGKEIGWNSLSEFTMQRVLYLSTVIYSFMNKDGGNPFAKLYTFNIDLRGPYNPLIQSALIDLEAQDYIRDAGNGRYSLDVRNVDLINEIPTARERIEWISTVMFILGIYGENQIYEFIFRDPLYLDALRRQTSKTIDTNEENLTLIQLEKFRGVFEKSLGEKSEQLDKKDYLELYFEYIFSQIISPSKDEIND